MDYFGDFCVDCHVACEYMNSIASSKAYAF